MSQTHRILQELVMKTRPFLPVLLALLSIALPATAADQYKRECGFGTTCEEANAGALAECAKAGGIVMGPAGPCLQWMERLRECVICKIPEEREPTRCEVNARALQAALDACAGRESCAVPGPTPDGSA